MDYVITAAIAAGGIWTGYLVGQLTSIKETNRRLSVLANERDEYKAGVEHWIAESDRQADIIARYQAKKPERDTEGKFTSKKARVTAELQAYVASKKETAA